MIYYVDVAKNHDALYEQQGALLEWRTVPPTEPGWYWLAWKDCEAPVIRQIVDFGMFLSVSVNDGFETYVPLTQYAARVTYWLGPLPAPEMPK